MELRSKYDPVTFISHQPSFADILGPSPTVSLLADTSTASDSDSKPLPLFHEACIYHAKTQSVFVTSQPIPTRSDRPCPATADRQIKLHRIHDHSDPTSFTTDDVRVQDITPPGLEQSMLNGGVNHHHNHHDPNSDSILLCAQGSLEDHPSGLISYDVNSGSVTPILTSFHGRPFNSVNDVIIHPLDGSIWFTDPHYGHHQGFRRPPQLPNQVYRFCTRSGSVRAIADHFTRPNGLCFSPDLTTLYVTDTGAIHGASHVPVDVAGPSHIYAFDIVYHADTDADADADAKSGDAFLTNRRLFAYAPGLFPDGIKCDTRGNVYAGCGDGIEVWNSRGVLIGTIGVEGGVANFCFGEKGHLYVCNETRFWKVGLSGEDVRGALLGL